MPVWGVGLWLTNSIENSNLHSFTFCPVILKWEKIYKDKKFKDLVMKKCSVRKK